MPRKQGARRDFVTGSRTGRDFSRDRSLTTNHQSVVRAKLADEMSQNKGAAKWRLPYAVGPPPQRPALRCNCSSNVLGRKKLPLAPCFRRAEALLQRSSGRSDDADRKYQSLYRVTSAAATACFPWTKLRQQLSAPVTMQKAILWVQVLIPK